MKTAALNTSTNDINAVKVTFSDGSTVVLLAQPLTAAGVPISAIEPVELDPQKLDPDKPRASPGFASVWWNGHLFRLTKYQRPIIQALWHARERGVDYVGGDLLLELAGCESKKMSQVFKRSPAWNNLIVNAAMFEDGPPDTYRLAPLVSTAA